MSIEFDHTKGTFHGALGISDHRSDEIDATIFFTIIDQRMLAENLFDDIDDAPANMKAKTGILEKVFDITKNEQERIYATLQYSAIDNDMENNVKGIREFIKGLFLLYTGVDGNYSKFVKKFIGYKSKIAASMQEDDDDDDNFGDDD